MTPLTADAFLIRLPAGAAPALAVAGRGGRVRAAGVQFELEPLFAVRPPAPDAPGIAPTPTFEWHVARTAAATDVANAWALAHALHAAAGLAAPALVEPDFLQVWPYENPLTRSNTGLAAAGEVCLFNDQRSDLPHVDREFAWHLDDRFTQLRIARATAGTGSGTAIRIAHLDTGFDPAHDTRPAHLRADLQRNFVNGQPENDAQDPGDRGLLKNPGHGTGTLSILAGARCAYDKDGYLFDDVLGGAPDAEIVPVRVGNSVVQLLTSSVAKGINYAVELCAHDQTRIHVMSMSMGGLASAAWADAVNMAYDAGVVFVAAAGNNISGGFFAIPTHMIVYPARFHRVIAACGVMANRKPYYDLPFKTMQGNWGPSSKMATALSAYTPNMPWAEIGCAPMVDMDGAGTSSATPQVAAAAALYLQRHAATLLDPVQYPEPWMRVEAVRQALFSAADKSPDGGSPKKLGNGLLRAADALTVAPALAASLHKTAPDRAIFPLLRVLTGLGAAPSSTTDAMLALEATQLAHRWFDTQTPNPFDDLVPDPDLPAEAIPPAQMQQFLEAVLDHPDASPPLKARVRDARRALLGSGGPAPTPPIRRRRSKTGTEPVTPTSVPSEPVVSPAGPPAPASMLRPFKAPNPPFRCLRGYSIDPSLTSQLDLAPIGEVLFKVPWESLAPGPIGEYLDVIDIDPASGCFYEPVNLEDPLILAQDGLAPSEGTPQFHQQMAYAVASLTIRNFERALGRKSLWRPGPPPAGEADENDSVFVQRLRVYPHALRERNAYYSPAKIALLMGYFNAPSDDPGDHAPGALVFTCLSHDIVAHETTHALLDGMHRRFLLPTNADVRAFHEAFADIVALMQHFTFPSVLKHQIASTRGEIRSHENLLGQLAGQFGRTTGLRGALRDAIGTIDPVTSTWKPHQPDPGEYQRTLQPHKRGALLVAAVFDAFLGIYERRTADLLRLATGGTGVLQPGAIHPNLVDRLCTEASRSAGHVLEICIRALDYCPPTDITFGEFLRAIITADTDAVPDDDFRYRVAFLEAFRRRGIYPRDLKTLSEDSLRWRTPDNDDPQPSQALQEGLDLVRDYVPRFLFAQGADGSIEPREAIFHLQRSMRRDLHRWLKRHVETHAEGRRDAAFLGLDPARSFQVHTARFAQRLNPDGNIDTVLVMAVLQKRWIASDPAVPGSPDVPFEGGATLIVDLRQLRIRYCVRKSLQSVTREQRQQAFTSTQLEGLRATYFGAASTLAEHEPFALMHRGI